MYIRDACIPDGKAFIMTKEPLTLYKLIILYMLDRVTFSLTKAQISDFILEREYTNFMTLQQAFAELEDADLITTHTSRNRTYLEITSEGHDTLTYFGGRISSSIKKDIDHFFAENEMEMRNEVAIRADYYKATSGEYEAHLIAKEKDVTMVEITLSVPDETTASSICANWQTENQDIYQYLVSRLF